MTSPYFTHLYSGTLDVSMHVGSLQMRILTDSPFRYVAKTYYSKPLYASDILTADDLISVSTTEDSTYQLEETVAASEEEPIDDANLIETPPFPQFSTLAESITADSVKPYDGEHRISDDYTREVFRSARELAYGDPIQLTPFMPVGRTSVSFYQENELVAEVFNQAIPGRSFSSRTSSADTLAYGLMFALASEDYELMGAQLVAISELAKTLQLIETVNGFYQPGHQLGFPKEFYRHDARVLNLDVSVYENSLLAFSLVRVIKYFRNRPLAAGIDITIYDSLQALLLNIGFLIEATSDKVSAVVYDPVPSEHSSLWASIALGEILSISYHRTLHGLAARLFLALDGPLELNDELSEGLVQSTKYLWALLYGQDTSDSLLYQERHVDCDRLAQFWWGALTHSELPEPTDLAEEALHTWASSDLNLSSEATFYLHAYEAQAFTTYLYQWAAYMWPSGRMWPSEDSTNSGVLAAIFKMVAASAFDYGLELFMLQNSNRVGQMQAHYLEKYSPKPIFSSDRFWSAWLVRSKQLTDFSEKAQHWGLSDFGFYVETDLVLSADRDDQLASDLVSADEVVTRAYINRHYKHIDVWDYPVPYEHFDSNLEPSNRLFNPNRAVDVDSLFYQQLTRAVDGEGELVTLSLRPVPGFTYYADASSNFAVGDDLDMTADSPFVILPLSHLVAQVKVVCPSIFNFPELLVPIGIQLNIHTYQTASTFSLSGLQGSSPALCPSGSVPVTSDGQFVVVGTEQVCSTP